jgi:hypothetical protein
MGRWGVNLVLPAGNYAWGPSHACGSLPTPLDTNQDGPDPRLLPKRTYVDTIALTGAAFCHECGLGPRLEGDLIISAFGPNTLWALDLNGKRMAITGQRTLLRADLGAIAVERGPDGRIYFSDASGVWVLIRRG